MASGRLPEESPWAPQLVARRRSRRRKLMGRGTSTRHLAFQIAVPPWATATATRPTYYSRAASKASF
eukprot:36690-Prymnesium_polylepis.3